MAVAGVTGCWAKREIWQKNSANAAVAVLKKNSFISGRNYFMGDEI